MLIHRARDQEADEVIPARRLELVPTDIGLAHPAALIANSWQDFHRPAGLGSSRQGPGGTGWLVAQLPSVSGFAVRTSGEDHQPEFSRVVRLVPVRGKCICICCYCMPVTRSAIVVNSEMRHVSLGTVVTATSRK